MTNLIRSLLCTLVIVGYGVHTAQAQILQDSNPAPLQDANADPALLPVPSAGGNSDTDATTEHLKNTISVWAGAWQSQIPDLYLSYYTADYVAPGYDSRKSWLADRQAKVLAPKSIKIRLLDFSLVELKGDRAVTRFTLIFEKPGYSDKTLKELVLTKQNDMWRIAEENNLAVERL